MNTLWYRLTNRSHCRKVYDGTDYVNIVITYSIFNIISEYIMFDLLDMDYYWYYSKFLGFEKVYDIDSIL